MLNKCYILLFMSCFAVLEIASQEQACRPNNVINIDVSDDFILSWDAFPDERCEISHFVVAIRVDGEETVHITEETSLDVSFMPTCVFAGIFLRAVSILNEESPVNMYFLNMPMPAEANLTLNYLQLKEQGDNRFSLAWDMPEDWRHCARHFRVLVYNENSNEAIDVYVDVASVVLENILPCERYTFGVTAFYTTETQGPTLTLNYVTPSRRLTPPALQKVTLGTTNAVLEWQLEAYAHNRCPVSSILVDASPYFTTLYPVRDNPSRPITTTRITSLEADTIYFLNVTVINTAGPSTPFLMAIQTLANN